MPQCRQPKTPKILKKDAGDFDFATDDRFKLPKMIQGQNCLIRFDESSGHWTLVPKNEKRKYKKTDEHPLIDNVRPIPYPRNKTEPEPAYHVGEGLKVTVYRLKRESTPARSSLSVLIPRYESPSHSPSSRVSTALDDVKALNLRVERYLRAIQKAGRTQAPPAAQQNAARMKEEAERAQTARMEEAKRAQTAREEAERAQTARMKEEAERAQTARMKEEAKRAQTAREAAERTRTARMKDEAERARQEEEARVNDARARMIEHHRKVFEKAALIGQLRQDRIAREHTDVLSMQKMQEQMERKRPNETLSVTHRQARLSYKAPQLVRPLSSSPVPTTTDMGILTSLSNAPTHVEAPLAVRAEALGVSKELGLLVQPRGDNTGSGVADTIRNVHALALGNAVVDPFRVGLIDEENRGVRRELVNMNTYINIFAMGAIFKGNRRKKLAALGVLGLLLTKGLHMVRISHNVTDMLCMGVESSSNHELARRAAQASAVTMHNKIAPLFHSLRTVHLQDMTDSEIKDWTTSWFCPQVNEVWGMLDGGYPTTPEVVKYATASKYICDQIKANEVNDEYLGRFMRDAGYLTTNCMTYEKRSIDTLLLNGGGEMIEGDTSAADLTTGSGESYYVSVLNTNTPGCNVRIVNGGLLEQLALNAGDNSSTASTTPPREIDAAAAAYVQLGANADQSLVEKIVYYSKIGAAVAVGVGVTAMAVNVIGASVALSAANMLGSGTVGIRFLLGGHFGKTRSGKKNRRRAHYEKKSSHYNRRTGRRK